MSYLTDVANYIDKKIDEHGELKDCKLKQCDVCDEIVKLRKSLDSKSVGIERKSNKKITYLVTNVKTGEKKKFLVMREVCDFLNLGRGAVQGRLATQKVIDNIKIERVVKQNEIQG